MQYDARYKDRRCRKLSWPIVEAYLYPCYRIRKTTQDCAPLDVRCTLKLNIEDFLVLRRTLLNK